MNKKTFTNLLNLATSNSYFMFNNKYYYQNEGLAMGQPLSAPLANIFLCLKEKQWLEDCPNEFKPAMYKRYVDDTFVIFRKQDHVDKFFEYINKQHQNIKFTKESEENKKLPFLDILLEHNDNGNIKTSIYRKKTYTGAGINFISHVYNNYKMSAFSSFLFRAWRLSNDYLSFHTELEFLRTYFLNNGYPENVFFNKVRTFINRRFKPKSIIQTAAKEDIYITFPFLSDKISTYLNRKLKGINDIYFPQVNLKLSFINNYKLKNFTNHKDKFPHLWSSDVVYKYKCAICGNCYLGSTTKALAIRISEHQGRSFRTNQIVAKPLQSTIRNHSEGICNKQVEAEEFSIIYKGKNLSEIRTAESILIKTLRPELNMEDSSVPLKVI